MMAKTIGRTVVLISLGIVFSHSVCGKGFFGIGREERVLLPERAVVMTNQANASIVIADAVTREIVWEWSPLSGEIPAERRSWFGNPSEVKPVYNNRCILMTASGGAVALIRIADKKVLFYGYAGINPHSAELLPDGNLVTASSTDGILATFRTDTLKGYGEMAAKYPLPAAHNVYWDTKRNKLYSAGHAMNIFDYNGRKDAPELVNRTSIKLFSEGEPVFSSHDLYPVKGEPDMLWLTTNEKVWKYSLDTNRIEPAYGLRAIKSISDSSFGTILLSPTEEWWSDRLMNERGEVVFEIPGFKIYKARWILP